MSTQALPGYRRLYATWAILMALTALSITAADAATAGAVRPLGIVSVTLVLGAGFFKAVQILWTYLNLRRSTMAWKATFVAFLVVICAVILAAYALALVHAA